MSRLVVTSLFLVYAVRAAHPCAPCHPREVEAYAGSPMARSMRVPGAPMARSARIPGDEPSGEFRHEVSDTVFKLRTSKAGAVQIIERRGIRAEYPVAWVIGSGNHASAFVVRVGDYLFQSPVSWYNRQKVWAMAPGFEQDRLPDYTRPITAECLLCHSGRSLPIELTINKYQSPYIAELGVSCDRCHGPVEMHLRRPSRSNIVNPAKLTPRARDSVCEQCHLSGEARISKPGRKVSEFQAGQEMEDVFSTYVFAGRRGGRPLKVISHAEQLRFSRCAQASAGKLWCGTCHDPHARVSDKSAFYRERCLSCHASTLAESHASRPECVQCHMPTRPARDGGHTAFTDHHISPSPASAGEVEAPQELVAWQKANTGFDSRNLGLAYIAVGERDGRAAFLERGRQLLANVQSAFASDPAVLTSLGVASLRQHRAEEAARLFGRAVELQPEAAAYYVNLAPAVFELGKADDAIAHLNRAIQLDPSLEVAYRRLVEVYAKSNRERQIDEVFERYLKFRPQSLSAREALGKNSSH